MYLWQTLAPPAWWSEHETGFANRTDVAVVERPGRKQLLIEIACRSKADATALQREFGGRFSKLRSDWLTQFARQRSRPLQIGKRLTITNVGAASTPRQPRQRRNSRRQCRCQIIIPAGAAFGTGQHVTTAMSLRLLEQVTRRWEPRWAIADLGTGSGILALAAKVFGARAVFAVDNDPVAISTAKSNARLNGIDRINFQVVDVRRCRLPVRLDVVTANLFSELLIAVIPKLRRVSTLIFSGIMRDQEREVVAALKRNSFQIATVRRRGKWVAMLARGEGGSSIPLLDDSRKERSCSK